MFYWKRQILHEKVEVFYVSQHLGLRCAPRSQLRLSSRAEATCRLANHPSTASQGGKREYWERVLLKEEKEAICAWRNTECREKGSHERNNKYSRKEMPYILVAVMDKVQDPTRGSNKRRSSSKLSNQSRGPHSSTVAEKRFVHGHTQRLPEAAKHCSGSNEWFVWATSASSCRCTRSSALAIKNGSVAWKRKVEG